MTTALVLGSTGGIGNNIVRACLANSWTVRALHRPTSRTWMLDGLEVERVCGDLQDLGSLRRAMIGCDVVFHAAAYYPAHSLEMARSQRQAVGQMRNVLEAAAQTKVGRLVYTSTLTTVGQPAEPGRLADERDYYLPGSTRSAYFESKWAMEAEAWRAVAQGLPVVIVNPTAVFGPWDTKPTTGQILLLAARHHIPFWLDLQVNVVDARDVGRGHCLASERGRVGQRYLLGGENLPVKRLLELVAEQAGHPAPTWQLSTALVRRLVGVAEALGHLPLIPPLPLEHLKTLSEWQALNVAKAQAELGFSCRPISETLADTLAWFRSHGYL